MRIPCSTYRLQFNSRFTFKDALGFVPYLADLGITDIYASPIFCARAGSIHGYDVVDPSRINPEIGTGEEFAELAGAVAERGMGWIQDIVPNHMAFDGQNRMLMDVFENGSFSEHYKFFDIQWDHAYESMKGRVLAPFLGRPFGECLESGEIRIQFGKDGFSVNYFSLRYPLRIESYSAILSPNLGELRKALGPDHPDYIRLIGIICTLKGIPFQESTEERADQVRFLKGMLWEIYAGSEPVREFIDGNVSLVNAETGTADFSLLDQVLSEQFFRLSFWKVASEEINYRRFFSINELISLRVEDPQVFSRRHELIFRMVSEGMLTGLRIDHIDGLGDPLRYLKQLRDETGGIYTVVEKILALDEDLPANWPVQGTTGYDYLNRLNGIFCRRENEGEFDRIYSSLWDRRVHREDLLYEKKSIIIEHFMTGEVDNLAHLMKATSSKDRRGVDITLHGLRRAIFEVLALFPVYRTYISPGSFTGNDRRYIAEAVESAKKRNPALVNEINYLARFLLLKYEDYLGEEEKRAWLEFAVRFQQFTGPLMAKGFEDTLLYVYNRLVSQNEVGGDPFSFGTALPEFHQFLKTRSEDWPYTMNATSTHDAKRGEDVRARINVLSEIPREWEERLTSWSRLNEKHKTRLNGLLAPARNDEYLLYQTLVGTYPFEESGYGTFVGRIGEYAIKAIREAKVYTGWIKPDSDYERAFEDFVEKILDRSGDNPFLDDFAPFQKRIAGFGILNSLSQVVLKVCSPGIPDFYQGTDLWELHLVDPDNRRPVDYRKRIAMMEAIERERERPGLLQSLLDSAHDGRVKLFVTRRCLNARKRLAGLFRSGGYIPLATGGECKDCVVAFARRENSTWAICAAGRFFTKLADDPRGAAGGEVWRDTWVELPPDAPSQWANAIDGEPVAGERRLWAGAIFASLPAALLVPA